jgi:hypothetical protein
MSRLVVFFANLVPAPARHADLSTRCEAVAQRRRKA